MKQRSRLAFWVVVLAVLAALAACLGIASLVIRPMTDVGTEPASGDATRQAVESEPVEATQTAIIDAAVEEAGQDALVTATAVGQGQPTPALAFTQTAAIFDAVATADSYAATALPFDGQEVASLDRTFTIYDEAGNTLGNGQVKVFAPLTLGLSDRGEIRVEISVRGDVPPLEVTVGPGGGAGGDELDGEGAQLVGDQPLAVREYMGAGLRGLDVAHFRVEAVPQNGLRRVQPDAVTWWKWDIAPVGAEAIGQNYLEVYIYLPRTRDDGTRLDEETNTIPLTVDVLDPGPDPLPVGTLLAGVLSVLGAGGALFGGLQFIRARRRGGLLPPAISDDDPGGDVNLSIGDDVEGTLNVAGDDIITYQTIVNEAPTALIVGLIIGLTALVVGLVVIVMVLTSVL